MNKLITKTLTMPFKKLFNLLIFLQFTFLITSAQTITGKISDTAAKKDIGSAVVALLTTGDSILYKFTRTDKNGLFEIANAKPGK